MNHGCSSFRYLSFLQFPSLRKTLSVLYSITSLTGVSLNLLMLYSIWKNPTLHKPSYLLLAHLASTDFLIEGIAEPLIILTHYAYIKKWATIYCYISASTNLISYWLGLVSLYSLALISVDRLLAIRLKNRYRSFVTFQRIRMVTIPYWIGMFLFLLALFITNVRSTVLYICASFSLFVLLATITTCYFLSFYSLKKLMYSVSSSSQQPDNGTANFDVSQYRRSFNTMLLVMVTTLIFYLPYFCSAVVFTVNNGESYEEKTFAITPYKMIMISELLVATSSTVNPLLYLWRMQDIREAVKTTVKRIVRREHHSGEDEQA